jgi:hypothetical protein
VPDAPDDAMLQLVRALARDAARDWYRHAAGSKIDLHSGWRSIDTAPLDEAVELLATDGQGKPRPIPFPCKLTTSGSGWVSSDKGIPVGFTPSLWRPHTPPRK